MDGYVSPNKYFVVEDDVIIYRHHDRPIHCYGFIRDGTDIRLCCMCKSDCTEDYLGYKEFAKKIFNGTLCKIPMTGNTVAGSIVTQKQMIEISFDLDDLYQKIEYVLTHSSVVRLNLELLRIFCTQIYTYAVAAG